MLPWTYFLLNTLESDYFSLSTRAERAVSALETEVETRKATRKSFFFLLQGNVTMHLSSHSCAKKRSLAKRTEVAHERAEVGSALADLHPILACQ